MVYGLCSIVVAMGLWLVLGSYARTETSKGILVTDHPPTKVVAPAIGVLSQLTVGDDSFVRKGDMLGVVNVDRRDEGGRLVARDATASVDKRLALAGELFDIAHAQRRNETGRLQALITTSNEKMAQISDRMALQAQIVQSNEALYDQLGPVVAKGYVSKVAYEQRHQALLNARHALASLRQEEIEARSEVNQARAALGNLVTTEAKTMNDVNASVQNLSQQQAQMRGEQSYTLVAPIAGRVTALQTSIGRAVSASVPLMIIIPQDAKLLATLYAPSRAIGSVKPGDEVRLQYDTFPYQRFGSFPGRVVSVSRTALDPRDLEVPLKIEEPVYRIIVALPDQSVSAYGEKVALQPGMTLTAIIILERQSFLNWILSPLRAALRRNQ